MTVPAKWLGYFDCVALLVACNERKVTVPAKWLGYFDSWPVAARRLNQPRVTVPAKWLGYFDILFSGSDLEKLFL